MAKPKQEIAKVIETDGKAVVMSLRLDTPMHDRLRKMAYEQRRTMRDILLEGLELVLTKGKY